MIAPELHALQIDAAGACISPVEDGSETGFWIQTWTYVEVTGPSCDPDDLDDKPAEVCLDPHTKMVAKSMIKTIKSGKGPHNLDYDDTVNQLEKLLWKSGCTTANFVAEVDQLIVKLQARSDWLLAKYRNGERPSAT